MFRKLIFSFLILFALMPSIQAEFIEQTEQVEQMDIDSADKGVAAIAGLYGALIVAALPLETLRFLPSKVFRNLERYDISFYLPALAGLAVYGYWAKKRVEDDDEFKKMFGRGALVGSSVGILYLTRKLLWYRYGI